MSVLDYIATRFRDWANRRATRTMDARLTALDQRLTKLPQAQRRQAFDDLMQGLRLGDRNRAAVTDRMAAMARKHGLSPWMTKVHRP